MELKRKKSISVLFGLAIVRIAIGIALSALLPFSFFLIATQYGIILPANSSERIAKQLAVELRNEAEPSVVLENLPNHILYMIIDKENNIVKTNIDSEQLSGMTEYIKVGDIDSTVANGFYYIKVEQDDVTILLEYKIGSCYSSEKLNAFLPAPDILLISVILIFSILTIFWQIWRLSKRFRSELNLLILSARQTATQDFDGDVLESGIREIFTVQKSFQDMQVELKNSINRQQELQRMQKEQIMALVHDLKTPLTVTIGNLDLLAETELCGEQIHLNTAALEGLEKLSKYISLLAEITTAENLSLQHFDRLLATSLFATIKKQADLLCISKQIDFAFNAEANQIELLANPTMLERAFMNVLQNAVEHTPFGGTIRFQAKTDSDDDCLIIQIEDSGIGFSDAIMLRGKELFYSDRATKNDGHFGIGLYFANTVISKHNGTLELSRSTDLGGACVRILLKTL